MKTNRSISRTNHIWKIFVFLVFLKVGLLFPPLGVSQTISCGEMISSSISVVGERDSYTLQGVSQGDTVILRVGNASGTLDPHLELFDGNGALVASGQSILKKLTTAGPYTVIASDTGNDEIGNYNFSLQIINNPCSTTPISCGQNLSGAISSVAEIDAISLQGVGVGNTVDLRMKRTSGSLNPRLELYDGSGTQIATGSETILKKLTTAGPYTLLISDTDIGTLGYNLTGSYRLFMQIANNPCNSTSISCGQTLSGTVDLVAEADAYVLQGVSIGDTVNLQTGRTSGALSPDLDLYDGSGTKIIGGSNSITKKLTTAGPYTVLVSDDNNYETGTYNLFFQLVNNPCNGSPLACGQNLSGSISPVAEADVYSLQGVSTNDTVTLQMVKTTSVISPYLELYDGGGTKVASGSSGKITKKSTTAGPYRVLAYDGGNDNTGNYRLFLQLTNNPCNATPLSRGQLVNGSIGLPAEIDAYTFSAGAECVTVCLKQISGSLSPYMDLYNSSGTSQAGNASQIQKCFGAGGNFNLLVRDSGGAATGNYKVRLESGSIACSSLDLQDPAVTVVAPNGGETLQAGSTFTIQWTSSDNIGITSHEIRLSTDGGVSFPTVIATGLAGSVQSFDWSVPSGMSARGRIRIIAQDAAGNIGQDDSNNNFFIVDSAQLRTTSYTYDKLNRLVRVEYEDGTVITYTYDAVGNRTSLVTAPGQ